jgi:hypothetical protein
MLYIACIMSFVWRTSAQDTNPPGDLSKGALLAVRVVITVILGLGMLYGWLILNTFSRYGVEMDKKWKKRTDGWLEEKARAQYVPQPSPPHTPYFYPSSHFYPSSQTRPQFSQYPRYPETVPNYRSSSPAFPHVGYPPPSPTYGNSPPFIPPDLPDQSRSGSPQSTSSTSYTRVNTQSNKTSGLQREDSVSSAINNGPGYATQHPLPATPAKEALYSSIPPPKLVPQRIPLAVAPGSNLPPIPGSAMTALTNRSNANASLREGEDDDDDDDEDDDEDTAGLTTGGRPRGEVDDETHVLFRSPLISAQGSFSFAGSNQEAEENLLSGAEASGPPFTARVIPIPLEHGDSGETEF